MSSKSRKSSSTTTDIISTADRWTLFESMVNELGLVRQHLDSFDDFIDNQLNNIVAEINKIEPDIENYYVKLVRIETERPSIREADGSERAIYPSEARIRNLIYSIPLYLIMKPIVVENDVEEEKPQVKAYIGRIPLMLKSKLCPLANKSSDQLIEVGEDPTDPGGYFIINGSERVIVTQEYLVSNRVLVDYGRKGGPVTASAKIFSTVAGFRSLVTVERRSDRKLTVNFFSVPRPLPFGVLMKALGIKSDAEIATLVSDREDILIEFTPTLLQSHEVLDQNEALDFIGKRVAVGQTQQYRVIRAKFVLDHYLLPHLGTKDDDRKSKALFLAQMALRVLEIEYFGKEPDDKDHYANKRLKLAGEMLTSLFRVAFKSLYKDIKYQLEKNSKKGKLPNLRVAMRADVITERVRHALATGNWVGGKAGVSQLLDRTNYMSTYSNLRRVISPLIRSQAHFEARDLHATHWGKICVTPDTKVLLGDSISQIPINDLEQDFESFSVNTVDEMTHEEISSNLSAYQRISAKELGKQVIKLKTISGRIIKATEDHPFLTERGWIETGKLQLTDKVLIRPVLDTTVIQDDDESSLFTILEKDDFLTGSWTSVLAIEEKNRLEKDSEFLDSINLLPLDSDNPKLPTLVRLFSFAITDGSINNTVEFYCGTEKDSIQVQKDIEFLGFKSNTVSENNTSFIKNGSDNVEYRTFLTTKGGTFLRLLLSLGASRGRRTESETIFPEWIMNSSSLVKREFLGGLLGGDGAVPWYYARKGRTDSYKIRIPDLEMHKHPMYVESLVSFFKKIGKLFNEFKIETNKIIVRDTKRSDRKSISLTFNASKDNILRLCEYVGYRYCNEKQNKSQIILEYLKYRQQEISKRLEDKEQIFALSDSGMSPKMIVSQTNLGYRVVTSVLHRRDQEISFTFPKSSLSIGNFMETTLANKDTGMLFVPLDSLEIVDEDIVCDFTTVEDTHSFIANSFVTHNCPNETPEGPNCGLVKNLALQAYITSGTDANVVIDHVHNMPGVVKINNDILNNETFSGSSIDHSAFKIFVDGILIGTTTDKTNTGNPKVFDDLKKSRREGKLSYEINLALYLDDRAGVISINTDDGRVRRPLLICKDGKPLIKKEHVEKLKNGELTWYELVKKAGVIEYLDAEEEENAYIALQPKDLLPDHTHVEIAASTILGIATSAIPFAHHNQSPRNTYEAGMIKQALGLYASNFKYRADRRGHILQNPQIPLVGGKVLDLIGFNSRPCGQNAIVGVISFQGWNIQDAIVFNEASIQRGLFRSHFFRSYIAEEKKYMGGQEDKFEIPTKGVRGFRAQEVYRHLSEVDGVIEPEIEVSGGDVLVGRTSRPRFLEEYIELEQPEPQRRETSTSMRHGESGVVDTVIITETSEGNKLVKVKVRDQRIPELGDKFASRHGQKGVIGAILPQEDLPFTEDGIVPDLLLNPHAIPNRMTIGQVLEGMAALISSTEGYQFDATLFESPHPDVIAETLLKFGFHPHAETTMYDGITGKKMPSKIYITPIYYQKLHHLVADKIHARARGPVQILTRQPTEGRAREGGLRFGEMERDCIIGHGAAILLKERLLDESDKIEIYICERCGLIADHNNRTGQTSCKVCGTQDTNISKIAISYAFKLLMQELMSMTIKPSLILETTS